MENATSDTSVNKVPELVKPSSDMNLENVTNKVIISEDNAQSSERTVEEVDNNSNPSSYIGINSEVLNYPTINNSEEVITTGDVTKATTTDGNLEISILLEKLTSDTADTSNVKTKVVKKDDNCKIKENKIPLEGTKFEVYIPVDDAAVDSHSVDGQQNEDTNLSAADTKLYEYLKGTEGVTRKRHPEVLDENSVASHADSFKTYKITASASELEDNIKKKKVELFTTDKGPHWYNVRGNVVTPPVLMKNLTKVFESLPIFGKPKNRNELEQFQDEKIREFVGCDLANDEYEELEKYCSVDHLKTGDELLLKETLPSQGIEIEADMPSTSSATLCISKKNKLRIAKDPHNIYQTRLKYRGVRMMHLGQQDEKEESPEDTELEPGVDVLYRVRVYRPYLYQAQSDRSTRPRHSVFSCDVVLSGRNRLSELRDRIACPNDLDMRLDVSAALEAPPGPSAKEMFPSGFLFINNVFYVDTREGCVDHSAVIRQWAARRGLGEFPHRDLCATALGELVLRLGHPEVYVHQGACEHVFTVSEARLLAPADAPRAPHYPAHSALSHLQSVYCTTCAEFGARWVVVGCERVPFDPAFFCDPCLRVYLYRDNRKLGAFRAYPYRGNELNVLKPQG